MKTSTLIAAATVLSAVSLGMAGVVPLPLIPTSHPAFDAASFESTMNVQEELSENETRLAEALSKEMMAYRAIAASV